MAEIALQDIEKYFGDNYVIRKLNLTIAHKEFVVLLGPSGCGKTTTLRAIAGLETIDTGDIRIDGKAVQDLRAADRDIAFVFQLFALYPHLTAYDNIAFPLRATRESRSRGRRQGARGGARRCRSSISSSSRPSALSGGDMQRVAIGRALVRRPKAMLMDEPIGALDAKLREDMRTELKRLHIENDSTTVYVTHDQVEAMSLADRIAIMNDGVLQQVGTPAEVYRASGQPVRRPVHRQPGDEHPAGEAARPTADAAGAPGRRGRRRRSPFPRDLGRRIAEAKASAANLVRRHAAGGRADRAGGARPATSRSRRTSSSRSAPTTSSTSRSASSCLRARTHSGFVGRAGDTVWARLDPPQTHFFDTASGDVPQHQAWRLGMAQITPRQGHQDLRRQHGAEGTLASISPTASSSSCSARPAPARPRRSG